MTNEHNLQPSTPESFIEGERLYQSFIDSLRLVRGLEAKFSCAVLHIPELEMKETIANGEFAEIKTLGDRLSYAFYGEGEHREKYDALIHRAITGRVEDDPDTYSALVDLELTQEAIGLVRAGMVCQLGQKQLEKARIARHNEKVTGNSNGRSEASREAGNTDQLIGFNHMVRDLIESSTGRKMNLDREKVKEILKVVMPGDIENAEGIEKGISLEVAAKNLIERLMITHNPETAVIYGDIAADKIGGDLILFPNTTHQVSVDIKQTAPNELRRHLSDEQLNSPGSFIKSNSKVYLWLGSNGQVGNKFGLPADFREEAESLVQELIPYQLVA